MTKEIAKQLDEILNRITPEQSYFNVGQDERTICFKLVNFGLVKMERLPTGEYLIKVNNEGRKFLAEGGFTAQVEKEEFDRYHTEESTRQARRANRISLAAIVIAALALIVSVVTCQNEARDGKNIKTQSDTLSIDKSAAATKQTPA